MKSNQLKVAAKTAPKRKGRGISAGQGKTAGRGTKGQNARSGGSRRPGFEGGQTPMFQRIPKQRGFKSFKKPTATVTLGALEGSQLKTVSLESLVEAKLVDDSFTKAKIVATGELTKKLSIDATIQMSEAAKAAIIKAGGTVS